LAGGGTFSKLGRTDPFAFSGSNLGLRYKGQRAARRA
jgi:hypothetical protein